MAKINTTETGENGEIVQVQFDEEQKKKTITGTLETIQSKIKKKPLGNIEDIRELLLELFK